jgi:hypothetical protein
LDRALDGDFVRAARDHVTDLGFDHVTLDLHGYRTGSVSPEGEKDDSTDDEPLVEDVFTAEYPTDGA